MNSSQELSENNFNRKKFKEIPINNPFIRDNYYWDRENETFDKIKTAVLTVLLVPIRVICIIVLLLIAWCVSSIGLYGLSKDDLKNKPIVSGWRGMMKKFAGLLFRGMYFFGSAHFVRFVGKRAIPKEAPILIGGPHTSFFDALIVIYGSDGPGTVVGKIEAGQIPFYGKIIDFAQPIYVNRENHNSRVTTIQHILERVQSSEEWPQIVIFPEGTCTNRKSLIQFKTGAFNPGVPIQPVCIRYPNKIDTFTWTWSGPHVLTLMWRTLAQLHTFIEIEYLPVYVPNDAEKRNPKLYAQNVQQVMSKALNIPQSDYTFEDCKLMESALRCKLLFAEKIADIARLRAKIGLANSQIEEYIIKENFKGTEDYYLTFEEFIQRLKIAADNVSYTLFKQFISKSDIAEVIDFKEYLFHALFLCKNSESKIELIKVLFMLYGDSGRVQRSSFVQIFQHFTSLKEHELNNFFYQLDKNSLGSITFKDFHDATYEKDLRFKKLFKPNRNFRQKANSQ